MKDIILNQILIPSLQRLYEVDYDNIRFDVSERNLCARLAHHMENIMREYDQVHQSNLFGAYFVDVEYNRMGNGDLKHYENSQKCPQYMVSDLLIQSRGDSVNYLAVEMKKKGSMQNADKDRERLISLVKSSSQSNRPDCVHDTQLGAFIIVYYFFLLLLHKVTTSGCGIRPIFHSSYRQLKMFCPHTFTSESG